MIDAHHGDLHMVIATSVTMATYPSWLVLFGNTMLLPTEGTAPLDS
jgi:hypothetical protein